MKKPTNISINWFIHPLLNIKTQLFIISLKVLKYSDDEIST